MKFEHSLSLFLIVVAKNASLLDQARILYDFSLLNLKNATAQKENGGSWRRTDVLFNSKCIWHWCKLKNSTAQEENGWT